MSLGLFPAPLLQKSLCQLPGFRAGAIYLLFHKGQYPELILRLRHVLIQGLNNIALDQILAPGVKMHLFNCHSRWVILDCRAGFALAILPEFPAA